MSGRNYVNRLVVHKEDAPLVVDSLPPRDYQGMAYLYLYDENGDPILDESGYHKRDSARLIGGLAPRNGFPLYWGWLDDNWITLQWITKRASDYDEEGQAIVREATKNFKHDFRFSAGVNLNWRRPAKTMK